MKRKFLIMIMGLALFGCMDRFLDTSDEGDTRDSFGVKKAQSIFKTKARALRPLSFSSGSDSVSLSGASRAGSDALLSNTNLVPLWDDAIEYSHSSVRIVEIPLYSNTFTVISQVIKKKNNMENRHGVLASKKLIAAQRPEGVIQWFVVTLVPQAGSGEHVKASDFRYLGGDKFSGIVLCSSLEGNFQEAYLYERGHKKLPLHVAKRSFLKEEGIDYQEGDYTSLFLHEQGGAPMNYSFSESGGDVEPPTMYCLTCKKLLSKCSCGDGGGDDIIIRPTCFVCNNVGLGCGCCQSCRKWWYENCKHRPCAYCARYPCACGSFCSICLTAPCECRFCEHCGNRFCFGECQEGIVTPPPGCPYGKCRFDPCVCCSVCREPCLCPYKKCHERYCICCDFCKGECLCPNGKCHESPCQCPCHDRVNSEANPVKEMSIPTNNKSWKSNTWGMVRSNKDGTPKKHDGIDLDGVDGVTSVFSMFDGKVVRVVTGQPNRVGDGYPATYSGDKNNAGNRITIETTLPNGDKLNVSYFHLDVKANNPYTHSFKVGDNVTAGRAIGVVGYTGNPDRNVPHLHLKVHKNGKSVNPEEYLYTKFDPTTGTVTRDCNN